MLSLMIVPSLLSGFPRAMLDILCVACASCINILSWYDVEEIFCAVLSGDVAQSCGILLSALNSLIGYNAAEWVEPCVVNGHACND